MWRGLGLGWGDLCGGGGVGVICVEGVGWGDLCGGVWVG